MKKTETVPNPNYKEPHPLCPESDMKQMFCGHCGRKNEMVFYSKTIELSTWTRNPSRESGSPGKSYSSEDSALHSLLIELNDMKKKSIEYKGEKLLLDFRGEGSLNFLSAAYVHCGKCIPSILKHIHKLTLSSLSRTTVYINVCTVPEGPPDPNEDDFNDYIETLQSCSLALKKYKSFGFFNFQYHQLRYYNDDCPHMYDY